MSRVQVNRHGSVSITSDQGGAELASDLISWGQRRDARRAAAIRSKAEEKDEQCTFQPVLATSGKRRGGPTRGGASWVDQREARLREQKKEAVAREMAEVRPSAALRWLWPAALRADLSSAFQPPRSARSSRS
jgi:hypothetical protein